MRGDFHILRRVFDRIEGFLAYLGGLLILLMIISICYEIVARYFFLRPTLWSMGLVEYTLLCVTFLATGWVLKKDRHVKIDVALNALSERGQAILNITASIIGLVSCVIMLWYGLKTTWKIFLRNAMTAQDPEIPKFILLAFIPLGFFFLSIEFTRRTFDKLAILKSQKEKGQERRDTP